MTKQSPEGLEPIIAGRERHIYWRCFHCGDTFTKAQEQHARAHFGGAEDGLPVCQMRLPGEHNLLNILREQEDELRAFRTEDTELWRAIHSQAADHATALRCEEERGYAKGISDARSPSPALAEAVRALEEAQYAFDCIAEDFEISDGCTAEMLCGDKICEGGCIDRRRQVIRTALTNLRNLMGKEGGS